MEKNHNKLLNRRLILVLLSVACEFYLFTIFIVLSPYISRDLIPIADKEWRELFGLCIFLIAGFCRPLGGVIFSGLGDSPHRYKIFYISTVIMSFSSILLGLLPSAANIGIMAPILLILIRIIQGLVVGAEIPEGIIYSYEEAAIHLRVLATNLINIACSCGFLIATLFTLLLSNYLGEETWRFGMVGCGIFSLVVGFFLKDSFSGEVSQTKVNFIPLKGVFKNHKLNLLRLICFATFLTSGTSVFIYLMPSYLNHYFNYTKLQTHIISLFEIMGFISGQLIAAFFHEKLSKNFFITSGFFFKALLVFTFHSYIRHDIFVVAGLNTLCCFIFGFFVAKLPVIMICSFPRQMRFSGVSIVYNISFGVMFGVSHYAITWLIQLTKSLYMPSVYIVFFSYVSLISLWFMSKEVFFKYNR